MRPESGKDVGPRMPALASEHEFGSVQLFLQLVHALDGRRGRALPARRARIRRMRSALLRLAVSGSA